MLKKKRLLILISIYTIIFFSVVCYFTCNFIEEIAVTSFKKLYTAYSQALIITVNEMAGETGCYFSSSKQFPSDFSNCEKFYKKFATNLNVSKYCKNNSLMNGCLPVYKEYITTPSCAGFSENMLDRYNQTFVMRDNSTLTVFNQPSTVSKPLFAVDSNGKIFPNQSGYDQFSLVIMRNLHGDYYFHSNITYCLPTKNAKFQTLQDIYN